MQSTNSDFCTAFKSIVKPNTSFNFTKDGVWVTVSFLDDVLHQAVPAALRPHFQLCSYYLLAKYPGEPGLCDSMRKTCTGPIWRTTFTVQYVSTVTVRRTLRTMKSNSTPNYLYPNGHRCILVWTYCDALQRIKRQMIGDSCDNQYYTLTTWKLISKMSATKVACIIIEY